MHVQPGSPEGAATTGPAITRARRFGRLAAVTVLGAGLLALGVAERPKSLAPHSPTSRAHVCGERLALASSFLPTAMW
jgi:hypothetical protein